MQHELIFRGSLIQYWNAVFAHWKKSSVSLTEPPFEISAPSLSLPPFAGFIPKENETLGIAFYDEKHWEIVAVFADAVFGKSIVKLTVFYNDETFEERGKAALARWNKLQKSLERKGLLIDPTAQYQKKQERGIYNNEDTMKKLDDLRKTRREYIDREKNAPAKSHALSMANISRYLLIKYDPDLFENWKDIDYE